ncbi:T6SS phospholipase effector Tle1-like catalytic domain-containing protein [Pseudomonas aeruginosa]|uniref:T6SS phospholipase effector Tle1-like catalytic domain-containing protein n=2 Tax=Pseudomonas aeruginosa TaxID=287 RepID=UPI000FF46D47|nr:DUF2235 domain-containing protein [Pseudomonas aeruginosa]QGP95809.1 DUF2235 domain-containing protein [Pseudomonas aeruginosa]RPP74035.1 Rhs element Vgr protein [Pseudomonas aeruginosa]RPP90209.1 Rhs element Vgr protein [Pseudomonas aeruginosa]HBO7195359.1 DUF2235 domain-containing protein [Pseudomonas aeruginosa]
MSEEINVLREDIRVTVSVAPEFPKERLLPLEPSVLSKNISRQVEEERKYNEEKIKRDREGGGESSGIPCCKTLHVSIGYDGTNNNDRADGASLPPSRSNVAKLFHASVGEGSVQEGLGFFRYYCPGVGTVFPDIREYTPSSLGLIAAAGGENRVNWGITRLVDVLQGTLIPESPLLLDESQTMIENMATNGVAKVLTGGLLENGEKKRRAALEPKLKELEEKLRQRQDSGQKPHILAMRLYVYGFSRGAAEARTFANWLQELTRASGADGRVEYRFAGLPISIEFLGLFDTVAAVGLADSAPFAAGHMDWADDTMRLPDEAQAQCLSTILPEDCSFLKRCVHLISCHEQRASFPLDSIRRRDLDANGRRTGPSCYRQGTVEYAYPGVHSDVGGGYGVGNQGKAVGGSEFLLSQIALQHMYAEAFGAGAPLQVPKSAVHPDFHEVWREMTPETEAEFSVSEELATRFNAWQAQAKAGPLEEVIRRETALITAWRIDRYAGGLRNKAFFANVPPDMPEAQQKAWEALHKRRSREYAAAQQGEPLPPMSAAEQAEWDRNVALIGGEDKLRDLRVEKQFDPPLDQRQLLGAAAEFAHDYKGDWGVLDDCMTVGGVIDLLLGGTVFLINEEDEAEEYSQIHRDGSARYHQLFSAPDRVAPGQEKLVALFDEQVHDSRAWFMNTSAIGPREPFTDYFRYRLVHFDNESNKRLSVLATAGRVVGVGVMLASVGLSVKRRDPRMLLGLFLPSLARPLLSGKVGLPEISAFDPLTGIALPMVGGAALDNLRAFTREPGDKVEQIGQLPPPPPLAVAAVQSPALQQVLLAQQTVEALKARDLGSLAGLVAKAELTQAPAAATPAWLAEAKQALQDMGTEQAQPPGPGSAPGWLQRGKDLMESL